jgi:hypothetical protein
MSVQGWSRSSAASPSFATPFQKSEAAMHAQSSKEMLLRIALQYEARQQINSAEWIRKCARKKSHARGFAQPAIEEQDESETD